MTNKENEQQETSQYETLSDEILLKIGLQLIEKNRQAYEALARG